MNEDKKFTLTSVLAAPDSGDYGDSDYPGNCSGYPIKILLLHFEPDNVLDPMAGGGTTEDVCNELDVKYEGGDIKDGYNMYAEEYSDEEYDFIHWHPPYFKMHQKKYLELADHQENIANYDKWEEYVQKIMQGFDILWDALSNDKGILAILMGLRRTNGTMYDASPHLVLHKERAFYAEIAKIHMLKKWAGDRGETRSMGNQESIQVLDEQLSEETYVPPRVFQHKYVRTTHEKYLIFRKDE